MATGSEVTGVILAGGRGSRLGGRDKGLVAYRGRTLVSSVLERLAPQVDTIIISANRNIKCYEAYGWPVISDCLGGFQGPLAGVYTALISGRTPWVLTVPCDCPSLPMELRNRLFAATQECSTRVAIASDGKRLHYAFSLVARDHADNLRAALTRGERQLGLWLKANHPAIADFSDQPVSFQNLNIAEDFSE